MEKRLLTVADLTVLDGEEEPAPDARNAGSPKPFNNTPLEPPPSAVMPTWKWRPSE
jgi:hypothetical protein